MWVLTWLTRKCLLFNTHATSSSLSLILRSSAHKWNCSLFLSWLVMGPTWMNKHCGITTVRNRLGEPRQSHAYSGSVTPPLKYVEHIYICERGQGNRKLRLFFSDLITAQRQNEFLCTETLFSAVLLLPIRFTFNSHLLNQIDVTREGSSSINYTSFSVNLY